MTSKASQGKAVIAKGGGFYLKLREVSTLNSLPTSLGQQENYDIDKKLRPNTLAFRSWKSHNSLHLEGWWRTKFQAYQRQQAQVVQINTDLTGGQWLYPLATGNISLLDNAAS